MPERYYRELLRYFTRSAGDGDVAADLVQSAYTRIYAMQRSGGTVLDARALLYKTARNLAASGANRRLAEQRVLDALSLVAPTSAPSAESTAMAREQLNLFLQRLEAMPRKRRDVFILVRIYGFSYREAGEHLGMTETNIERHVMRGILDCAAYAPSRA
ncbi:MULTISPECIES: RNA polymerase sigma factor [Comamonas]|uniref:Sigma-70 family RNA polymerase sigma factor n=1 Tax=Comamonas squillarum TaxID=2977320 RepID=A0ABY6A3K3_9BURK|nr:MULTISPECIES: sigma-70 family RNA polymerase sigma factor [unclassified Comamonas]PWB19818.1 RNA polymerase subunit sigma-24 [Comamonas sp. JNW]UXC18796.1 sigma-70 family RNA polymerase sigma factor [Comamonas sp. PR12]